MELNPIGVVKSPVAQETDEDWGNVISEIHLEDQFSSGLEGIEGFSHILVIFYMHKSTFDPQVHLLRRPQGRDDMPMIGIFAQRAKHRPNPIGLTAVQLVARDKNILTVKGLDAIDGTPILDIKPYFPTFDRIDQPEAPEWVERIMRGYF